MNVVQGESPQEGAEHTELTLGQGGQQIVAKVPGTCSLSVLYSHLHTLIKEEKGLVLSELFGEDHMLPSMCAQHSRGVSRKMPCFVLKNVTLNFNVFSRKRELTFVL